MKCFENNTNLLKKPLKHLYLVIFGYEEKKTGKILVPVDKAYKCFTKIYRSLLVFIVYIFLENGCFVAINYLYITSHGDSIISIVLFSLFVSFSFYTHLLPLLFGGYMCFFINMILHFHSSLCLPDCLCS